MTCFVFANAIKVRYTLHRCHGIQMLVRYFIRITNANLRIELPRHAISIVRFLLSYLDVASPVKSNVSDRKARLFIVIYLYNSLVSWRGFVFPRFVFYCCGIEGLVPGPLTFESLSLWCSFSLFVIYFITFLSSFFFYRVAYMDVCVDQNGSNAKNREEQNPLTKIPFFLFCVSQNRFNHPFTYAK